MFLIFVTFILIISSVNCENKTKEISEATLIDTPKIFDELKIDSRLNDKNKINPLEILSSMGKAIQMFITQNRDMLKMKPVITNNNDTVVSESRQEETPKEKINEEAEILRKEITRRTNSLKFIVKSAITILEERGDVIISRILSSLNERIDQARSRTDKILKEPHTSEVAVKTLKTINLSLHSLASLVQNTLKKVNISINVDLNKDGKKDSLLNIKTDDTSKYKRSQ